MLHINSDTKKPLLSTEIEKYEDIIKYGPNLITIDSTVVRLFIQYYNRAKGQRPRHQRLLTSSDRKTVEGSC
uniref:Uncharacterized protein n=1 Tax=Romanomermis culicivorax TaxID=13658 RepID=A0A915IPK2_ROMCU